MSLLLALNYTTIPDEVRQLLVRHFQAQRRRAIMEAREAEQELMKLGAAPKHVIETKREWALRTTAERK